MLMRKISCNLLVNGKVGERCVEVLRDTGCAGVIIKQDLVNQEELTGEKGYVTTFDKTLLIRAPIAKIQVDTPYNVGEVEALCVQEPVADLIIGNITGARRQTIRIRNGNLLLQRSLGCELDKEIM